MFEAVIIGQIVSNCCTITYPPPHPLPRVSTYNVFYNDIWAPLPEYSPLFKLGKFLCHVVQAENKKNIH